MQPRTVRIGILAALLLAAVPLLRAADSAPATKAYTGKVVPLAPLLEKLNARMDKESVPHWLGLLTDDDKVYPLVKDDGSRMFFKDDQLLNRPMRLTARQVGDTPFLQVFQVHSLLKGKLHDVYYWCDICAIKRFEKRDCECCGAPMEFRETPLVK